jgi:hypothetical protein
MGRTSKLVFRISKFILPFKRQVFHWNHFIEWIDWNSKDLDYVLKPLFSFSGTGVIFHVKRGYRSSCWEGTLYPPKKVNYIPIVQSPEGKVKAEVRVLCVWKDDVAPTLLCNLVRLSRGEMIGVKFNQDKDWVGGTIGCLRSNRLISKDFRIEQGIFWHSLGLINIPIKLHNG